VAVRLADRFEGEGSGAAGGDEPVAPRAASA
jgi:hypothetical protein